MTNSVRCNRVFVNNRVRYNRVSLESFTEKQLISLLSPVKTANTKTVNSEDRLTKEKKVKKTYQNHSTPKLVMKSNMY